jgi:NAD(P)H-dependent FMN reductase
MTSTSQAPQTGPLDVAVIVGSTRPDRRAPRITRWLDAQLAERDDLRVDVIDLVDIDLPAHLPADDDPRAAALTKRIDDADAFVVVTPEYNHGYPASLKQAIDVPYREWNAKPVAFVSYGGMSGGIRAVEQLRQVFAELHAVTVRDGVAFPGTRVDTDGVAEDDRAAAAAKVMLDELAWWGQTLREARAERPYGS